MSNDYFVASGQPATGAFAASAPMRSEFSSIEDGFDKLPTLTANKAVVVNSAGSALVTTVGSLALAGNFATTGAFAVTLAASAAVTLTLPIVDGTLATLAGTETLSNKTLVAPALGTPISGVATNLTGTAAGLTAGNVTTNANLSGPISSSGNTTSITAQTGSGTTFVVQTSPTINNPTLTTPTLGVATATSLNKVTITAPATSATLTIGDGAMLAVTAGKTVTISNTITLTATDGSTLAIGTGGTLTSAAFTSTGTSGATIPLLNGANTWSAAQVLQAGTTTLGVQSTTRGALVLSNTASGSKAVTLQSSNSTSAAYTLTLPVDDGTSGQVLSTDGSGVTSWVGRGSDYNLIGSHTVSGSEATISFTGIDYEDVLIVVNGLTVDTTGQNLTMAVSINNGSGYGTAQAIGANSLLSGSAAYFATSATGVKTGFLVVNGMGSATATSFGINSGGSSVSGIHAFFTVGSQANALRFANSTGNFTGGTLTLYGR